MNEPQVLKVNTTTDENDGSAETGTGLSLRDAVIIANRTPGDEIIELEAGTYELTIEGEESFDEAEATATGDLDIARGSGKLTIRGLGEGVIINANQIDRVFHVRGSGDGGGTLALEKLAVTGGKATDEDGNGGGILVNSGATAELTDVTVTGNSTDTDANQFNAYGGGIFNQGALTIDNSQIGNNSARDGGGIHTFFEGSTTITNSTISNNTAGVGNTEKGRGGGIVHSSSGKTEITNTIIANNTAGDRGGGVYNSDEITITDSEIRGNTASFGGGVNINGLATIENTTIEDNTASTDGGGVAIETLLDKTTITNSTIQNNQANNDGAGIEAGGELALSDSVISGNIAVGDGGGINNSSGEVAVYSSTIDANSAGGSGGGLKEPNLVRDTTVSNNQSASLGGGIFSQQKSGVILNSTISGNQAILGGGGITVAGNTTNYTNFVYQYQDPPNKVAIANTTITNNSTPEGGAGIAVIGRRIDGAIPQTNQGEVVATNVTIANNVADSDNDGNGDGGGIFTRPIGDENTDTTRFEAGKITLSNSIVAGNVDTPDNNGMGEINPDIAGAAKGNANNLLGSTEGLIVDADLVAPEAESLGQGIDIIASNPGLGELQDNGGTTQTHALLPDSPAIDGGNNDNILPEQFVDIDGDGTPTAIDFNDDGKFDGGIPFDQRGGEFKRIIGENVDIGAFELNSSDNTNSNAGESGTEEKAENEADSANDNDSSNTIYRFFNQDTGVHFYTADETEKDVVLELDNFSFEGGSYRGVDPLTGTPEPQPVYRFFNQDTGVHLYTISETETDATQELDNFSFEGEAFYAYKTEIENSIPIYRFYNSSMGAHFYTPSEEEKDSIINNLPEFQSEGIAYYAEPLS